MKQLVGIGLGKIMIAGMILIAVCAMAGVLVKVIDIKDALLVIAPITTGFFTLMKGE